MKRSWPGWGGGVPTPTVQARGEGVSQDPGLPTWSAPETEAPAATHLHPRHQPLPGLDAGYCLNRPLGQGACFCPQHIHSWPRRSSREPA